MRCVFKIFVGASKIWVVPPDPPSPRTPLPRTFFPLPPPFFILSSFSRGVFSLNFIGARLGSQVGRVKPPLRGRRGFTFRGPGASNTTKISRENTKDRIWRGRGKKKRQILPPPHLSGPHFFWVCAFWSPHHDTHNLSKLDWPKLDKSGWPERDWPKLVFSVPCFSVNMSCWRCWFVHWSLVGIPTNWRSILSHLKEL